MSFFKNIFSSDKKATLDKGLEKSSSTFFDKLTKAVVDEEWVKINKNPYSNKNLKADF